MAPGTMPGKCENPRRAIRRFMIMTNLFGIFTAIIVVFSYQSKQSVSAVFLWELFWLLASAALCIWDLVDWRLRHGPCSEQQFGTSLERTPLLSTAVENLPSDSPDDGDNDDDQKDRPRLIMMVLDLFFALALFYIWTGILATVQMEFGWSRPYSVSDVILASYSSCAMMVGSICHACCFWKQLMMRMRLNWARGASEQRWHWQEQYNRLIEAAAQNMIRPGPLPASHGPATVRCCCPCNDHADDVARIVRQENALIDRLLRVLGKSPEKDGPVSQEDETVDTATIRPATRSKEVDILDADEESGPSYPRDFGPVVTPSPSTSDNDFAANDSLAEGMSPLPIASQSSAASERTISDGTEATLVKKKGRNLRKEKEREAETMYKV